MPILEIQLKDVLSGLGLTMDEVRPGKYNIFSDDLVYRLVHSSWVRLFR
jgi:hypothetical protein